MTSTPRADAAVLPDGFSVRGARPDDAPTVLALVQAHEDAGGAREPTPLAEVTADLTYPTLDHDRDTWLVHDADGRAVAYGIAYLDDPGSSLVDLYLDPALRRETAVAVGVAVGARGVARALEDARERGLERTDVHSGMLVGDPVLPEVLSVLGLRPDRLWWRMHAGAEVLRAAADRNLALPEGYDVVDADAGSDDVLRLAHVLRNATFRDHYGHVDSSWEDFVTATRHGAGYDPSALWFAVHVDSDAPIALLLGDDRQAELGGGYVAKLGVLPEHRGRGLGEVLLLTAFAEYARRGRTSVLLNVDTENGTGAVSLYERVGMTPTETIQSWAATLPT